MNSSDRVPATILALSIVSVVATVGVSVALSQERRPAQSGPAPATARAAKPQRALVWLYGADSQVERPAYYRVTSREKWVRAWEQHHGVDANDTKYPCPEVNFEECIVVAIFQGRRENSRGVGGSLVEDAGRLVFRFGDCSYQTGLQADPCSAFGIFVIRSTKRAIALEEDTQYLIGQPPIWTPRRWSNLE